MAASASAADSAANPAAPSASTCYESNECSSPESGSGSGTTTDQRMAARGSHWSFLEKARFEAALHKFGPFAWRAIIRAVGTRSEKQVKAYAARYRRRKKLAARAAMEAYQESVNVHQQMLTPNDGCSAIAVAPGPMGNASVASAMVPHVAAAAAAAAASPYGMPMHATPFATANPAQCHAALFLTPLAMPPQGAPSTTSTVSSCSTLASPKLAASLKKGRRSTSGQTSSGQLRQATRAAVVASPGGRMIKEEAKELVRECLSSSAATLTPRISSDVPHSRCRASLESNSSSTTTKADDITQTLMLLQQSLQTAKLEKNCNKMKDCKSNIKEGRSTQEVDMGSSEGFRESKALPSMSSYDLMMKQVAADMIRPPVVTRVGQNEDGRVTVGRDRGRYEAAHISEGVLDDDALMSESNGDLLLPQFDNSGYDGAVTAYNNISTYCNDPYFYLP